MSETKRPPEGMEKDKRPDKESSEQIDQDVTDVTKAAQADAMAVIEDSGDSRTNADSEIRIVLKGEKYFFIDKNGNKKVLKGKMADGVDYAYGFVHGIAKVEFDGKSYYLNKNGDLITEKDYESISCFGVEGVEVDTGSMGV